jgi:hypothetical protein
MTGLDAACMGILQRLAVIGVLVYGLDATAAITISRPVLSPNLRHILMLLFGMNVPGPVCKQMWLEHSVKSIAWQGKRTFVKERCKSYQRR